MRTLPLDKLPRPLLEAARSVSTRLLSAGYEAWIVGGAVRDLLLNLSPKDVDIATNAHPDEVERLFKKTSAVGKAFGTIVVHQARHEFSPELQAELEAASGVDIEVTTYRADGEYLDARRPEQVSYSTRLEDDAARRDFTCNALFGSALTGELRDPTGGLEDLLQGRLRCVGEARERFTEDGLRLMRLARFEGRFGLQPSPETLAGARAAADSLRGVSPERIRVELEGMFASQNPFLALTRLVDLGLLERAFAAMGGQAPGQWSERIQLFRGTSGGFCAGLGFALLLAPHSAHDSSAAQAMGQAALEFLRPSKALLRTVTSLWDGARQLRRLSLLSECKPSQSFPLLRSDHWPEILRLIQIQAVNAAAPGELAHQLATAQSLEAQRSALPADTLNPPPLLSSTDLAATQIARGPRWGELLREAGDLQVDGELLDRQAALDWLARQASAPGS